MSARGLSLPVVAAVLLVGLAPSGVAVADKPTRVTLCHEGKTKTVNSKQVARHAAHGDTGGECGCLLADESGTGNAWFHYDTGLSSGTAQITWDLGVAPGTP